MSVLQTAIISNLINEQRNSILDQARQNDQNRRIQNDLESQKNRLTKQAEKNEEQFLTQAGRANRAERELYNTQTQLNEAEQALVAHSLATDEAFKDLMMEIYGTSPDKEERVKKDLAKFKYRTQQILEKKKNIPKKPKENNIQAYLKIAYNDDQLSKLSIEDLNNLITLHRSLQFWKNQSIDYFPEVELSKSIMLSHKKPKENNIRGYLKIAYNEEQISKLSIEDLNDLITLHKSLQFWKNQSIDCFPEVELSKSVILNNKNNSLKYSF